MVVAEEEKYFVFHNGPADGAPELVTHVDRFDTDWREYAIDQYRVSGQRVARAPFIVAIIEKSGTMKLVCAALGDGIGYAAR